MIALGALIPTWGGSSVPPEGGHAAMFGDPGQHPSNNNRPQPKNGGKRMSLVLIAVGLMALVGLAMVLVVI